jgi:Cu/Ag efflux protein CusF
MRRPMCTLLLPLALAACGGDRDTSAPPPATTGMATPAATPVPVASPTMVPADQMTIRAEVVKVDAAAKSVTLRDVSPAGGGANTANQKVMTVEDATSLSNLKEGDAVAVTCRTNISVPMPGGTAPAGAGDTSPAPATSTTATDATAMASVGACSSVITIAPGDQAPTSTGALAPAAGTTASPTTGR